MEDGGGGYLPSDCPLYKFCYFVTDVLQPQNLVTLLKFDGGYESGYKIDKFVA